MSNTMIMRLIKQNNSNGFVNQGRCVQWGNMENDVFVCQRIPEPKEMMINLSFQSMEIAGKSYTSMEQLCYHLVSDKQCRYQDIYGRMVIDANERFPCFDSFDALHENRFYHHLFMMEDNKLWYIYYGDDKPEQIKIIEDAAMIESSVWRKLLSWHFVEDKQEVIITEL